MHKTKWRHLQGIKFQSLGKRPIIDMLIGIDYADLHFSIRDVRGRANEPIARLTPLGWTCIGNPYPAYQPKYSTHLNRTYHIQANARARVDDTDTLLQRFWEIESYGECQNEAEMSRDDESALEKVKSSMTFKNGQYQVSMPWKSDKPDLPNNYSMALRRLENTEKRLNRSPDVATAYGDTIQKYIEKGYVRKVPEAEKVPEREWYLPHFAVVKPDRTTTKTRIVFDASAKFGGVSLNDAIHQGPKLQRDLFDVLLRFRKHPVAIACDIAEMYLRINVAPEDRSCQRFLWRDLEQDRPPDVYEFSSVVFGVNASPFQAQFVAQEHARKYREKYPMAAETVLKSTYMDDSIDSVPDERQGIELYNQLSELWGKAGMYARKWLSNSVTVLQNIPQEDRASEVELDGGYLPSVKTLGMSWIADSDEFTFKSQNIDSEFKFSKRNFLRKVAMLFDPLGFLSPFTIRAKILLQDMWSLGLEWDDNLPDDLTRKAKSWFAELGELENVRVSRCVQNKTSAQVESKTLHTFVDASMEAYGAVVYARYTYEDGSVSTRLVAGKSKVAPLQSTSIPRLELLGAVLGLQLTLAVCKTLEMDMSDVTFWCDSMNVLWWIRGRSRAFKTFVANRIGKIHEHSTPKQWRYVPTRENPADLVSRGVSVELLTNSDIWWYAPKFLEQSESDWPENCIDTPDTAKEEVKKAKKAIENEVANAKSRQVTLSSVKKEVTEKVVDPRNYSDLNKLKRVRAWIYRFINNSQIPSHKRLFGELTSTEIEDSEIEIIREMQKEEFYPEYKALSNDRDLPHNSKLQHLQPRLDEYGLMRSHGRLQHAEFLPFDVRYPIILSRKNWVTRLIVKHYHEIGKHVSGTNHTLSVLSTKYWIIAAREEIRAWEKECSVCKRQKAKVATQIMAPLPDIRLKRPLRAFDRCAVDYAGPFITVQGRGKRREKRYLCLFTCMTSRAVHLEVAYGLDTDSFLNAFFRMVNRRGLPSEVLSDNGTNFVGANRELQELVQQIDKNKVEQKTADRGIKWHFNPPLAPHFGGVHETMIKAAKRAIVAILQNADVTDEELMTAFTGAEALINSRPLTYQSMNPKDDVPLTPNHFLFGQIGGQFAPQSVDETDFNPRKRWRRIQEVVRHFWNRWLKEWVPGLNTRKKWVHPQKDLKEGDVVIVMNQNEPRGNWPLGRIVEVFPGSDGHVRVVRLKIGTNTIVRPISKLCPLELDV